MKKKIELMHELFGKIESHRCKECIHMPHRNEKNCYQKCEVYGNTNSESSDWAKSYIACGMFNKEYNGNPVIKMRTKEKRNIVIDGQMSIEFD